MSNNIHFQLLRELENLKLDFIWLTGGWAVDFHMGEVLRLHDDIDIVCEHSQLKNLQTALGKIKDLNFRKKSDESIVFDYCTPPQLSVSVFFVEPDDKNQLTKTVGKRFEHVKWSNNTFSTSNQKTLNDITLQIISLPSLYKSKLWNGRKKDMIDLKNLDKIIFEIDQKNKA